MEFVEVERKKERYLEAIGKMDKPDLIICCLCNREIKDITYNGGDLRPNQIRQTCADCARAYQAGYRAGSKRDGAKESFCSKCGQKGKTKDMFLICLDCR